MPPAVVEPRVELSSLRVFEPSELEGLPERLGLAPRRCIVLVGGAAGLAPDDELPHVFRDVVAEVASSLAATVVDGATDTGVMRLIGRARAETAASFPLVGVVPAALADDLEPNHTHVVLVPGSDWGDETPWLAGVATALAGPHASATLVVNGGEITWADAEASVAAGRPVVVLAGSGRTADALAAGTDERADRIARSGLLHVADRDLLAQTLLDLLAA